MIPLPNELFEVLVCFSVQKQKLSFRLQIIRKLTGIRTRKELKFPKIFQIVYFNFKKVYVEIPTKKSQAKEFLKHLENLNGIQIDFFYSSVSNTSNNSINYKTPELRQMFESIRKQTFQTSIYLCKVPGQT